jgi:type II secretory pathway predicted ATPase ExeA
MMKINQQLNPMKTIDDVDYCRTFSLLQTPFVAEFDQSKFYQGASRAAILDDILINIRKQSACLLVKANKGAGKTAMCKMIQHELDDSACLYVNCSTQFPSASIEQQLANGLLLGNALDIEHSALEQALLQCLNYNKRLVIFIEGDAQLTAAQVNWFETIKVLTEKKGKTFSLVLFSEEANYNSTNTCLKQSFLVQGFELLALEQYEVYEYLYDHLNRCGHTTGLLFSRQLSRIIAKESLGNFKKLTQLATTSLENAYKKGFHYPERQDVPRLKNSSFKTFLPIEDNAAFLTARNSLLVGLASGCLMLALFWSVFAKNEQIEIEPDVLVLSSETTIDYISQ